MAFISDINPHAHLAAPTGARLLPLCMPKGSEGFQTAAMPSNTARRLPKHQDQLEKCQALRGYPLKGCFT